MERVRGEGGGRVRGGVERVRGEGWESEGWRESEGWGWGE